MPYASSIKVLSDGNGTSHAFLADNGTLWTCKWDANAQGWVKSEEVPETSGAFGIQAIYLEDLWPNGRQTVEGQGSESNPGVVLAYRRGKDSNSEIYASFGFWDSNGILQWTAPSPLTDDNVNDQQFELVKNEVPNEYGIFSLVAQKQPNSPTAQDIFEQSKSNNISNISKNIIEQLTSGLKPDTDLYFTSYQINRTNEGTTLNLNRLSSGETLQINTLKKADSTSKANIASKEVINFGNQQIERNKLISTPTVTAEIFESSTSEKSPNDVLKTSGGYGGGASHTWKFGGNGNSSSSGSVGPELYPTRYIISYGTKIKKSSEQIRNNQIDKVRAPEEPVIEQSFLYDSTVDFDEYLIKSTVDDSAMRQSVGLDSNTIKDAEKSTEIIEDTFDAEQIKANSSNIVTVQSGNKGEETNIETGSPRIVLTGLFGGLKAGAGGTSVVNFAKAEYASPTSIENSNAGGFFAKNVREGGQNVVGGKKLDGTFQSYVFGAGIKSVFNYDKSINNPLSLQSYIENESGGGGLIRHQSKRYENGGQIQFTGGFNIGGIWEERYTDKNSDLPSWLAYYGRVEEAASLFFNTASPVDGLKGQKFVRTKWYDGFKGDTNYSTTGNSFTTDVAYNENKTKYKAVRPTLAILNSFVLPAAADILLQETESDNRDNSGVGVSVGVEIALEYLSKYMVGVKGTAIDQVSHFFTGGLTGTTQNSFLLNAGLAASFGVYIPLVAISSEKSWNNNNSANTNKNKINTVSENSQTSILGSNSTAKGASFYAETGDNYPLTYAPEYGSNMGVLSADSTNGAESDVVILGANIKPISLKLFNLYSGSSSSAKNTSPQYINIRYKGKKLTPTDGPIEVDILGTYTNANKSDKRAKAKISINPNGELESVEIVADGSYAYLSPEDNETGYYLDLDLYSNNLIDKDGKPPLMVMAPSNINSTGLVATDVQRIPTSVIYASDQNYQTTQSIYPIIASDGTLINPSGTNNSTYSYTDVPLKLYYQEEETDSTKTEITLINQESTGRLIFSAGSLIGIQPDEDLYFENENNQNLIYILEVNIESYNEKLKNLPNISLTIPTPQSVAYNNVVHDESFSAQAGLTNTGVYLSDGITDTVPLFPEYSRRDVSNRVVWSTVIFNESSSGTIIKEIDNYFLNATDGSAYQPGYINTQLNEYNNPNLEKDDLYLPTFTAAFTPTAASLEPKESSNFGGDTFVAWVETTNSVVPISEESNGETSYINYMNSLYNNQRINFTINQGSGVGWINVEAKDKYLYYPENAVITELKAFNVNVSNSSEQNTFLAWVEIPLPGVSDPTATLKVAQINPNAKTPTWTDLTSSTGDSSSGNSTIQSIPWGETDRFKALTVNDLSMSSLPSYINGTDQPAVEIPIISFSRDVPTPYLQSVLNDDPSIYLQFDAIKAGITSINIGTLQGDTTQTYASETGLDFSIDSALPKANTTAVENTNGTGVLSSGLGTNNAAISQILNQVLPNDIPDNGQGEIAEFIGSIAADRNTANQSILTVTNLKSGSINAGDTLTGADIIPGTVITKILTDYDKESLTNGVFEISNSQDVTSTEIKSYPEIKSFTYSNLNASIAPSINNEYGVLDVTQLTGALSIGYRVGGLGIEPGTTITSINRDQTTNNIISYNVNIPQTVGTSDEPVSVIAVPGGTSSPYTIEFWTKHNSKNDNPSGAGLVAFGQPSEQAIGEAEMPEGWLMTSVFAVDRISYQQAAAQGDDSATEAISNGTNQDEIYGWGWSLVAQGTNTTAMNGNGGSNLYKNALNLNNLVAGLSLNGVTAFLEANDLSPEDLPGLGNTSANIMATIPQTQLAFAHFIDESNERPQSNLESVAIDTGSAVLNQGFIAYDPNNAPINNLFNTLWQFQEQTGEAKVTFTDAPVSYKLFQAINTSFPNLSSQLIKENLNDNDSLAELIAEDESIPDLASAQAWLENKEKEFKNHTASTDNPFAIDQYSGFELGFNLTSGAAVSTNKDNQFIYDVSPDVSIVGPSLEQFYLLESITEKWPDFNEGVWQDTVASKDSLANYIATNSPEYTKEQALIWIESEVSDIAKKQREDPSWAYVAASYLPDFKEFESENQVRRDVPVNTGSAELYINNKLVAKNSDNQPVVDAYRPGNVNDEIVMLTNNVGGSIDQLAIYGDALSSEELPSIPSTWNIPTSDEALDLFRQAGVSVETKTPDPGEIPGAVTAHWDARNVNPNDAVNNTFYSVFEPITQSTSGLTGQWSEAIPLNPSLEIVPTIPSATSTIDSIQDNFTLSISSNQWNEDTWDVNAASSSGANIKFNPSMLILDSVQVELDPSNRLSLTSDQILVGNSSIARIQPMATSTNLNFQFLTDSPQITLTIPPKQFTNGNDTTIEEIIDSGIKTATVILKFTNQTSATIENLKINQAGIELENLLDISDLAQSKDLNSIIAPIENNNKVLATAQIVEQAPLQLKYIDSGEVFRSTSSASTANQTSASTPAQSFGTSQTAGSFTTNSDGPTNGWLAIAQPFSSDALSDPGGRVWIQYTGQFTVNESTGVRTAVEDSANAPITWLNALADSNFSPDQVNRPLENSAINQNSSGGLLIKADPTVGWGDNFGSNMITVNNNGTEDLVIAAPQANNGGRVYIIDGAWIEDNLTTANGATTLDLSNPDEFGNNVTVLTPGIESSSSESKEPTDNANFANFGASLAFDDTSKTLFIGGPNYLRQLNSSQPDALESLQSIGALYSYQLPSGSSGNSQPTSLTPLLLGSGGTLSAIGPNGQPSTSYWGSQLGTSIAIGSGGQLAVSEPGTQAGLLYSGTKKAHETFVDGKNNQSFGGELYGIQLPDSSNAVDISKGVNSNFHYLNDDPTSLQSTFMQNLEVLQTDNIVGATVYNNQAIQSGPIGAVQYFANASELDNPTSTYYGPQPWNVLGGSEFGSSLAFIDLVNNQSQQLAIGANASGGPGATYIINPDHSQSNNLANDLSSLSSDNQYLAHAVAGLTLYGAESLDQFGSELLNLGDVNQDGYEDLLITAPNASNAAGSAYVLFGSDQFDQTKGNPNPAVGTIAPGAIGEFRTAVGTNFFSSILLEQGYGKGFTGSGTFSSGDINADGINDIQLGAGPNGNAYLTWGHPYLKSINNLALDKLASNTGYMLDGLATTTAGSLRSIGDFNGDGYGDFISIQPGDSVNNVRLELGANTQETLADYLYNHYNFTVTPDTQVLPAGDINGDGLADIALFLNDNVSSAADGNQSAGSTTGVLYGRSSDQLPIGSGFGLLSPVNPDTNAPLLSLPSQSISGGLSDASPALIADGSNLFATVKGNSDNTIWFASSSDGGSSWSDWNDLSSSNPAFATTTAPSLAFFDQKLQMSFVDPSGALKISSFNPASTSLSDWSTPASIATTPLIATTQPSATRFNSKFSPALIDQGDALAVVWLDSSAGASSGTLYSAVSTTPDTKTTTYSSPSTWSGVDGGSSPASPALAQLDNTLYMAVQGNGDNAIYWSSSTDNGSGWAEWQALPSGMSSVKPPSLAAFGDSLFLSYLGDGNNEINITRLTDAATNSWATQYQIPWSGGTQSALQASLVTESINGNEQLAVYYLSNDESQSELLRTATTDPTTSSGWSQQINVEYSDGSGNQTASGPLAVSSENGQTVIAYQGGTVSTPSNEIYLATSSSPTSSSSWSAQAYTDPGQQTGLGLTNAGDELLLSYSTSSSPDALQLQQFSNDNNTWSETQATTRPLISSGSNLVSILNSSGSDLLLAGIDTSSKDIDVSFVESSTTNSSWTAPSQLLERITAEDGTVSFTPISATAAPAATLLSGNPVVAVNNNANIDVYSPSESGSSLTLATSFSATGSTAAINPSTAPGLTTTDTGLALTYTNTNQSIKIERLDFLTLDGKTTSDVTISAGGFVTRNTDQLWQSTTLDSDNSGISTTLGTAPVVVDGNLLLTTIDSTSDEVRINAIPALSDPDSTTWINSTIQLPDGKNGWLISQTDANAPSTLTALGDLDGDGNDDLIVTNPSLTVDVIDAPEAWSGVDGGSSPASPALAQLDNTLYMAVQGNGDSDIYWSSSTDNGSVWADWQALPSNLTSNKPPSLAVYDETLYLSYIGTDQQEIVLTTLDTSTNSWSEVYRVLYSGGQQSALQASLVTETINGTDQLVLYYISDDDNQSELLRSEGTPADSTWSDPVALEYNDDSGNQTASGPLAVSSKNGQTVIAYQGGTVSTPSDAIYLTTSSTPNNSSSWSLQSPINPDQQTGLGLTRNGNDLLLSYSNSTSPDALQLQQFSNDNNTWNKTQANSTPLISSGSNLVSILNSTATTTETIVFAGVDAGSKDIDVKVASTNTQNSGLRLINGAPSPEQMATLNDATAQSQTVQLAPVPPSNAVGITASLTGNHFLSLTAANSNTTSDLDAAPIQPGNVLATAGVLESAEQLYADAIATGSGAWSTSDASPLTGSPAINTTTSFGDLNGDGYQDYLSAVPEQVYGHDGYTWNVWSIRAAGDVNGNGKDDVLLALAPVTPTTITTEPNFLQTVLIDGELFKISLNDNDSFGTFSLAPEGLKRPLNPYSFAEAYDNKSTESYEYIPLMQNWLEPILSYVPPTLTNASLSNGVNPANAEAYEIPASVANENTIYTAFKGDSGSTLWVASQDINNESPAIQTQIPNGFVPGREYAAVAAALFKDKNTGEDNLFVVTTDKDGDLYITGGDPSDVGGWQLNEQIKTSNDTNPESTPVGTQIAFLPEGDRLALYFTSDDKSYSPRYLYSTDPINPGTWGSSFDATTKSYTGSSVAINTDKSDGIVATLFQNKTVLIYNNKEGNTTILSSQRFQPTGSKDWISSTQDYDLNPNSLTSDQSQLYLTGYDGFDEGFDEGGLITFKPNLEWGQWVENGEATIDSYYAYAFLANGQLKASAPPENKYNGDLYISDIDLTTDNSTVQKSLAGYSIDGNIDVNGDGFKDMLVSDPSDPSLSVNNQYVLFGGDYSGIASQVGTNSSDTLVGTPLADVIYTIAGDDTVITNGGRDVIYTGAGSDSISITDNNFSRIDAGSGIDSLLLQGNANQDFDFRLDVPTPEFFAGTKLQNIEAISSVNYGANILSFDTEAIAAINEDRMLFLTPDSTDTINLYGNENASGQSTNFKRNINYDTQFGGVGWNAYTTKISGFDQAYSSPSIAYVLNPQTTDKDLWLDKHVNVNPASSSTSSLPSATSTFESESDLSSSIQTISNIASQKEFGDGLKLTAFKGGSSSNSSRYEVSREYGSKRQVVAYASAQANSIATPGRDYNAIAGQLVLNKNELSKVITIPHVEQRFDKLRKGSTSLVVEEVKDIGQKPLHLVVATQKGTELGEVLSGFGFTPNSNNQSSLLSFRTNTTPVTNSDINSLEQADYGPINSSQTGLSIVSTEPTLSETTTQEARSSETKQAILSSTTASGLPNSTQQQDTTTSGNVGSPAVASTATAASPSETPTTSSRVNTPSTASSPSSQAAEVTIYRRATADASINSPSTLSKTISINDADSDQIDPGFDHDIKANNQVGVELLLDTEPGTYLVSLVDTQGGVQPLTSLGETPATPDPEPITPDPEPITPGETPTTSENLAVIEVDGSPRLLVIPFTDGEEQLITVDPETFTDSVQPIVEVEGGISNESPIAISFNLIEASEQPLDFNTPTAGGGTIASNAPAGINLSVDGVYFNSAAGADDITGSAHNDFIRAGANDDLIDSGNGDDLIRAGAGSDTITTGEGLDRIYYTADQLDGSADTVLDFSTSDRVVLGENILASLVDNVATFSTTIDGVERQSTLTFAGSSVIFDDLFITTT